MALKLTSEIGILYYFNDEEKKKLVNANEKIEHLLVTTNAWEENGLSDSWRNQESESWNEFKYEFQIGWDDDEDDEDGYYRDGATTYRDEDDWDEYQRERDENEDRQYEFGEELLDDEEEQDINEEEMNLLLSQLGIQVAQIYNPINYDYRKN